MLKNYLKTALRNLGKNKLYTFINIFGLTVGLAAPLLIGVYIAHELSYDRFNTRGNRIARVTMEYSKSGTVNRTAVTGTKPGPQFKRIFPAVSESVRTFIRGRVIKNGDKIFDEPRILYADTPFFKVFSFPFIEGNPGTALESGDRIVLTRASARKYFGNEEALNKTLEVGEQQFTVSGVCEDAPQNSQLKFDFVIPFANLGDIARNEMWWTANWITYLELADENGFASLEKQINSYMNTPAIRTEAGLEGTDYLSYRLEPLFRVHLYSPLAGSEPNGSIANIYLFATIALLILIIASANFTNLSAVQSAGRTGEIGMRKVMGATRSQLFFQFLGESTLITCLAALMAFALGFLLIPFLNRVTGRTFERGVLLTPVPILCLFCFTLIVSFLAGLYPALILSGTRILLVLKKGFNFTGGNNLLRKTLIVLQFGISVFLIIYTIIILQQLRFLQTKNLGYDKEHIVALPINPHIHSDFQNVKAALKRTPGVEDITAAYETPEYIQWGDGITAVDEKGKHEISLNAIPVDLDFVRTLKMQLVAGRDFQQSDFAMMDTSNHGAHFVQPYIINETLAKKIGWEPEKAIGRTIEKNVKGPVVGVVKDFNFSSLHDPIGPLLIFLGRDFAKVFMVRLTGNDLPAELNKLATVWKERAPDQPFSYHFLDEDYDKLYLAEQRSGALYTVAAGLAIFLACLGLFGLASFTAIQRAKEISIRRTLGASVSNITLLISKGFLQLVGISLLIAMPLAWWAGDSWLQDFAFRIPVHLYVFVLTALITLLITLSTVGYHSIKTALTNPVKSLAAD